jgi:hypothetical protein
MRFEREIIECGKYVVCEQIMTKRKLLLTETEKMY